MRTAFLAGVVALILFALPGVGVFTADLLGYGAAVNGWLEATVGVSHRLALGIPAAVVLFCIPPLIVLLYFLRLQRKAMAVPSTFLWKKSIEDLHVNRLMQWMRRNVLLLLQLLAVMVLLYAVLGPRLHGSLFGGRHFILLIDNSASMSATDVTEGGKDRLAWAKAEAIKEIEAAAAGDVGMVIAFNGTAEIRQSYTASKDELKAAVEGIRPTHSSTRIDEALSLAASLANPARSTENEAAAPANPEPGKERTYVQSDGIKADVFLYSDGRFPPVPEFALTNLNVNWRRPPTPSDFGRSDNVGIVRFDVERDPTNPVSVTARGEVRNYRGTEASVRVRLDVTDAGTGRLVTSPSTTLILPVQKERKAKEFTDVALPKPPGDGAEASDELASTLLVRFDPFDLPENADVLFTLKLQLPDDGPGDKAWKDAFPHDDTAWVVFGVARKANVLVVTDENKVLANYFETPSAMRLADFTYLKPADLTDKKEYLEPALEGKFDLVIFDRCAPAVESQLPLANTLFIGSPPPPWKPLSAGGEDAVLEAKTPEVRVWQTDHPVMRNLRALDRIRIADAFKFPVARPLPPRTPRLMDGDGDTVLLAALARHTFTDFVLTFPLVSKAPDGGVQWHSDWPLQPNFVLFLRNLLIHGGGVEAAGAAESLRPGQAITFRPRGAKEIFVTKPGESTGAKAERSTNRADVVYSGADVLGPYAAEWGTTTRRFAVNLFDPLEGDLAPLDDGELKIGAESLTAGDTRKQPRDLWKYLLVVGLAVVMGEWWVYNKRVQI